MRGYKGKRFCVSEHFWRESNRPKNGYEMIFKLRISDRAPNAHADTGNLENTFCDRDRRSFHS